MQPFCNENRIGAILVRSVIIAFVLGGQAHGNPLASDLAPMTSSEMKYVQKAYVGSSLNPKNPADPNCTLLKIIEKSSGEVTDIFLSTNDEYIAATYLWNRNDFEPKPSPDFPGFTQIATLNDNVSIISQLVRIVVQGEDPFYERAIAWKKTGGFFDDRHERSGQFECENLKLTQELESDYRVPAVDVGFEAPLMRTDGYDDFHWTHVFYRGEPTKPSRDQVGECVLSVSIDKRDRTITELMVTAGETAGFQLSRSGYKGPFETRGKGRVVIIGSGSRSQIEPRPAPDYPQWIKLGTEIFSRTQRLGGIFDRRSLNFTEEDNIYVQGDEPGYTAVLATKHIESVYNDGRNPPQTTDKGQMTIECRNLHEVARRRSLYGSLDGVGESGFFVKD
jgi:hypothetical protein